MPRPKRVFTDEDEQKMFDYALAGCQNGTIATLMCIPLTTLIRRFGSLLREKRAERKFNIRNNQTNLSEHNPAMAIFLGKNELEQVDKVEVLTETKVPKVSEDEMPVYEEAANTIKLKLSRGKTGS